MSVSVVVVVQEGGEEEREDTRKKRKIAAAATERTSTGTDITTPFGDEVDDRAIYFGSVSPQYLCCVYVAVQLSSRGVSLWAMAGLEAVKIGKSITKKKKHDSKINKRPNT